MYFSPPMVLSIGLTTPIISSFLKRSPKRRTMEFVFSLVTTFTPAFQASLIISFDFRPPSHEPVTPSYFALSDRFYNLLGFREMSFVSFVVIDDFEVGDYIQALTVLRCEKDILQLLITPIDVIFYLLCSINPFPFPFEVSCIHDSCVGGCMWWQEVV